MSTKRDLFRLLIQARNASFLEAGGYRVGLLMNVNVRLFVDGLRRHVR